MSKEGFPQAPNPKELIQDVETAREAAKLEKPIRDAARAVEMSPEDKREIDRVATDRSHRQFGHLAGSLENKKAYSEEKEVNGISLKLDWVSSNAGFFNGYELYFPQIENLPMEEEAIRPSATIGISKQTASAKDIFDYACKVAESEPDVLKVYEKVQDKVKKMGAMLDAPDYDTIASLYRS